MTAFRDLLRSAPEPGALATHLDGLAHDERVRQIRSLSPRELRVLFEGCAGAPADLEHFVPTAVPAGKPVRHFGVNSLPLFRQFEKRFMRRPSDRGSGPSERIWGYNHQALAPLTGPGYFVLDAPGPGSEPAIDYYQVPDASPGAGWPDVRGNTSLRSRFVYGFMKDMMRRVSAHVSVGRAVRKGKPMNAYFALVRES